MTETSYKAFVLVHLTSSLGTNVESQLLTELWREMARKFGDLKFCEIRADMCIEGYPERNTPTILIYRNGDIKKQVITLKELRGQDTTLGGKFFIRTWTGTAGRLADEDIYIDLQKLLVSVGAVEENDHRVLRLKHVGNLRRSDTSATVEDDDDWD